MRILELTLLAPDVAAMRAFYGDRLGLPIVGETSTSMTFRVGDTRLTFESAGPRENPFYHFAFNIAEHLFDAGVRWISERAKVLTSESQTTFHFPSWNAHSVYFEDPAGNIGELIARHALRTPSRARLDARTAHQAEFGPRALLSVSEIGLPVTGVPEASRFLSAATDTPLWGSPGVTFTALGDDHGLFIVVDRDRAWYPTERRAEMFPIVLTVEGRRERRIRIPGSPYLVVTRPR